MKTGNNLSDLSNIPDDIHFNFSLFGGSKSSTTTTSSGGKSGGGASAMQSAGGIIDGATSVISLIQSKKASKEYAKNMGVAASAANQQAQLAANQAAESKARLESAKAKLEADKAGKIMGMSKPAFYGVIGISLLVLVIGGIVIYKRVSK